MNIKFVLAAVIIAALLSGPLMNHAWAKSADSKAKKAIDKAIKNFVHKKYGQYCDILANTTTTALTDIYHKDCTHPPPVNHPPVAKIAVNTTSAAVGDIVAVDGSGSTDPDGTITHYEWSGTNYANDMAPKTQFIMTNVSQIVVGLKVTDNNGSSSSTSVIVKNSAPTPCPPGTHRDANGACVPDVNPSSCVIGAVPSGYVRVATTADTRVNGKEFKLMVDCKADLKIIDGDLWYSDSSSAWFKAVENLGFNPTNTMISCGNHDTCSTINSWLGTSKNWADRSFFDGKVQVVTIDGNSVSCSGAQFNDVKASLEGSDAWIKVVSIHQPFITVKSTHGPNGSFQCYHDLFKANGVNLVLQGHNHIYAHAKIDSIDYTIGAPGTHDTGSSLYPCGSSTDQLGHPMRCIRDNGVLFMDIKVDNPSAKLIKATAVSLGGKILDSFQN